MLYGMSRNMLKVAGARGISACVRAALPTARVGACACSALLEKRDRGDATRPQVCTSAAWCAVSLQREFDGRIKADGSLYSSGRLYETTTSRKLPGHRRRPRRGFAAPGRQSHIAWQPSNRAGRASHTTLHTPGDSGRQRRPLRSITVTGRKTHIARQPRGCRAM